MKILITNDDGIDSPILPLLVQYARRFGEVTVVAPKVEQSGKSQALEFRNEIEIKRTDRFPNVEAWVVDSTPADCVRFGVTGLKRSYDLVLSGINRGYNLGDDIVYSGTIGAIMEGARLGIRGLALSAEHHAFLSSVEELDRVADFFRTHDLFAYNDLYNVNIPPRVQGISITRQGRMYFSDDFEYRGNDRYLQVGAPVVEPVTDRGVDIDAIHSDLISITPLSFSRTNLPAFERLRDELTEV